jgi:arylsulfatase A-like enzyme
MKTILISFLALAASLIAAERKPNFIFIIADDHRWDAMSAVQKEHGEKGRYPFFETPNMDRLAAGGVRFRNAFITHSICSPGRAGFLTGQYTHENGIMDNNTPFPEKAVTHATLLRDAGYQTAYFGKWHMGEKQSERPGFQHSASFIGQGRYMDCPVLINGVVTPTKGWIDDVSTDFAIDWMKQNHAKPFSIVLGFKSPHNKRGGDNLPERLRGLYEGNTTRRTPNCDLAAVYHKPLTDADKGKDRGLSANSVHLDYLRHIKGIDENLGRLLDALDDMKLTDDTVIVYSSDNGYFLGERGLGDKRALYEEGIRIPFIVRYPRLFPKGKLVDELVINQDLAPTWLDLAGLPAHPGMHGRSFKALAQGDKPADWRKSLLAIYRKELGDTPTCHGVRTEDAKLIIYPNKPEWTEAYDLKNDPYELVNLASNKKFTASLEAEIEEHCKNLGYPASPKARKSPPPAKDPLAPIKDEPGLPRVLLIGDSISMGYTLPVRDLLRGKANLHRIPINGGSTKTGIANFGQWLGEQKWDVIHFNWGLHDIKHMKGDKLDITGEQVCTPAEYEANLRSLVTQMKASGAKLIWASTTPVPQGAQGRVPGDEVRYNAVAARVMEEMKVPSNDLHALCLPELANWQLPKDVHFKSEGSAGLAAKVAAEIVAALR